MNDAVLKELLFKHYWAQGYFAQTEVDIHFQEGVDGTNKFITDVDVYALRPHPDLCYERILGDCRTLKAMSPVNRALWVRGLMDLIGAKTGCVLLSSNTRIERDHKLAANQLGVTLLNQNEFKVYDRSIVYPDGSEKVVVSTKDLAVLKSLPSRFPKLERVTSYLYRDAWREDGPHKLIRHTLAALRSTYGEFDPAKPEHVALFCDSAAIFGIGLAECAGRIFQQYLQPDDKGTLSESLRVLVWGGKETYNYYQKYHKKLLQIRAGVEVDEQDSLELPEWNGFVQLIRNILEYPAAAFTVPLLLRRMASDTLNKAAILEDATSKDLVALKLAMLTLSYLVKASIIPREFEQTLVDQLVAVQTRLAISGRTLERPETVNSVRPDQAVPDTK